MIQYAIRHKSTGKLMPLAIKGKGYSWWNPGNQKYKFVAELKGSIRLFANKRYAEQAILGWFNFPNGEIRGYTTADGEDDYDFMDNQDGRSKNDLEIVKVIISIRGVA